MNNVIAVGPVWGGPLEVLPHDESRVDPRVRSTLVNGVIVEGTMFPHAGGSIQDCLNPQH